MRYSKEKWITKFAGRDARTLNWQRREKVS
jgi:hypothetical protein